MNEFASLGMPYTDVEKLIYTAAGNAKFAGTVTYLSARGITFDDVIQECLLHTWRYQSQYDATVAKPSTFVFLCVKSAINRLYAKQSRNGREAHGNDLSVQAVLEDAAHPAYSDFMRASAVSDGTTARVTIMDVTRILTQHYGPATTAAFFEVASKALTEREAAEALGIKRGALSLRFQRMRRKLALEYREEAA